LQEKNKGVDTLKKTSDFKTYKVEYINKNPNEQIIKAQFADDTFAFTLCHLKGIRLHTLKCGKLSLVTDEPTGYIHFNASDKFHHHVSFYLTPIKTAPRYYERKVYVKRDLCFTVLAKAAPKMSKCILIGYGSYNTIDTPKYSPHYVALILEGWTIVIAHLRGGGEYGYKGYSEGRLAHKKNTFLDFIKIADYLVEHKYTTYKKLAIWGRSAGGLLIANVLNMRPDICQLAILGVPFVMPKETMANYKNPLGLESRSEFADSEIDPIANINLSHDYPNIFIYTNFYDTIVPYKEPLRYYTVIKEAHVFREKKINIYIDNKYGHTQGSSEESKIHIYSIIMDQLKLIE
jgi:protease II